MNLNRLRARSLLRRAFRAVQAISASTSTWIAATAKRLRALLVRPRVAPSLAAGPTCRHRLNRQCSVFTALTALWMLPTFTCIAAEKPGDFRLRLSTDAKFCRVVGALLNAPNIKREARKAGVAFATWRSTENIERGDFDGPVEETRIDLDNDGLSDRVVKAKFSLGGALTDTLHIAPAIAGKLSIRQILASDATISFIDSARAIERTKELHGENWEKWFFNGMAVLEPFRYRNQTYVLAQNVTKVSDVSARTYVFQLGSARGIKDICMFGRVCPCTGCTDLRGSEVAAMQPSSNFCAARSFGNEPLAVGRPAVKVNDLWTFSQRDLQTKVLRREFKLVVTNVGDDLITASEVSTDTTTVIFGRDWDLRARGSQKYAAPLQSFKFPMAAGAKWTYTVPTYDLQCGPMKTTYHAVVERWEDISVPAGKFRALRVDHEGARDTECYGVKTTLRFWYVPDLRQYAKYEVVNYSTHDGRVLDGFVIELNAFALHK